MNFPFVRIYVTLDVVILTSVLLIFSYIIFCAKTLVVIERINSTEKMTVNSDNRI